MAASLDPRLLTPHSPRRFVPADVDLRDRSVVAALFENLLQRTPESPQDLADWLAAYSELQAAVDQQSALLYVNMTCHTDEPAHADAYKAFVESVLPAMKPLQDRAKKAFVDAKRRLAPGDQRLALLDRKWRADIERYRDENVPLETRDDLLSQEYQRICGAMTVIYHNEERTLPQMALYQMKNDRAVREEAWRATARRRLQDRERIETVFDRMLDIRNRIALNAGCADFVDYQFRALHRFDYTREHCLEYHDAVQRCVVPVWARVLRRRQNALGVETLRPWDTTVDVLGRDPLRPFDTADELIDKCAQVFHRTHAQFGEQFDEMKMLGLLDLASRKGKAPGGYQHLFAEARKPFIFMNAVGIDADLRTLLHEGGHAFHALASVHEPVYPYRRAPIEFCEVASFGMELLGGEFLDIFYSDPEARRSRRDFFEGKISLLAWVATVDAFQHWLYTHPGHTRDERREEWIRTYDRFGGGVIDWSGLDEERAFLWHRQPHFFVTPLYYIEYGIAQLGALQVWLHARREPAAALRDYRRALALGGSRPLPELFDAAGLRFDFSEKAIRPLVDAVQAELDRLDQ